MARLMNQKSRVLRTGQPLALEAIRQVAPAVFAPAAHPERGPRYAYVPTIQPLQALLDSGWGVYEASQQRARAADRDPYTKHMLRMRKLNAWEAKRGDDGVPEVILINAHDGTAAYKVMAGYFRFVCSNGLIAGTMLGNIVVRHTVGLQTSAEVLAAHEHTITNKFPTLVEQIGRMKKYKVPDTDVQMLLANRALELRYGSDLPPFDAAELLQVRRDEDKDPTLWNLLNRIQENVMTGGWETRSTMLNRRSKVRPVERVTAVANINSGLWDTAVGLLPA